ncbi:MAG: hypothetical protein R3F43_26385 [bacterium]
MWNRTVADIERMCSGRIVPIQAEERYLVQADLDRPGGHRLQTGLADPCHGRSPPPELCGAIERAPAITEQGLIARPEKERDAPLTDQRKALWPAVHVSAAPGGERVASLLEVSANPSTCGPNGDDQSIVDAQPTAEES